MQHIPEQAEIPSSTIEQHPPVLAFSTTGSTSPGQLTKSPVQSNSAIPAIDGQNLANGFGVLGASKSGDGVHGESSGDTMSAVAGIHYGAGKGIYGRSARGDAGYFEGNVVVNGDLVVTGDVRLGGQDCAESFECGEKEQLEPGTVVVAADDGRVRQSSQRYDKRVVGVVAGAGTFKPGLILVGPQAAGSVAAIALMGRVFCKVDACDAPIQVGDLLTTSGSTGRAMRASDETRMAGTVIGKALASHAAGHGMIPILVGLK